MPRRAATEFLVLGPLEVRVDVRSLPLGGAKQRAVLGLLVLHAEEVVPIGRVVDGVWGDDPPASAAQTVESYVSHLRRQIEPHGPSLVRRGDGYRLDLAGARVDARDAEELVRSAAAASDVGEHARALDLAREALDLWRGPALRDAPLHGAGRAEANELDELRLRVVERMVEAEIALGRHDDAIARLRPLVDEHPYRERFVAQLMLALYHAGRAADALDVYERTRQGLADDLGLQPGAELRRLSAEVVRHDPSLAPRAPEASELASAAAPRRPPADSGRPRRLTGRLAALAALLALVAAAASVAILAGAGRGSGAGDDAKRVALVVPRQPIAGQDTYAPYVDGLLGARRVYGIETTTIAVDAAAQTLSDELRERLGDFDLVLLGGPAVHQRFVGEVARHPGTHFVFVDPDPSWPEQQVNVFPNSTDIFFIEGPASYLAAFMGTRVAEARTHASGRMVVSVVAGDPIVNENLVAGFRLGARAAVPGAAVLVDYSHDFANPAPCRRLANRQIDRGARLVFAAAGACSLGALSAAAVRGPLAVGVNLDRSELGPHVVASVVKRVDRAVEFAIRSFLDGTLEGGSLDIGIERQAVGIAEINPAVPTEIRREVETLAERRLPEWASWSTPRPRQGDG